MLLIATLLSAVNALLRQKQKLEAEVKQLQEVNQNLETEIKQGITPRILRSQKQGNNNILCLLDSSSLFTIELLVSFYYTDVDGFERLIGEGFVEYINPKDGKIHAIIDKPQTIYQAILDRLASNDLKIIQETRVRPGVLRKYSSP